MLSKFGVSNLFFSGYSLSETFSVPHDFDLLMKILPDDSNSTSLLFSVIGSQDVAL